MCSSDLKENEFLIVTGTAFLVHDSQWLEKQREENGFQNVQIKDVTKELAVFGIWGPKAREILQELTESDLENQAFPFGHSKEINIAGISLRATRITYVGELGWELYIPWEAGLAIWQKLIDTGSKFGAKPCGYRAIESLRLEKGYVAWGVEINTETNPYEANLGFAVSKVKEEFLGKEALNRLASPTRTLTTLVLDDIKNVPIGNEPIRIGEKIIGRIKSAGQGYSINRAIAYAYLPSEYSKLNTNLEVSILGNWFSAQVASSPLFDPIGEKIKA